MSKGKADKPPDQVEVFYNLDGTYLYKLNGEFVSLKLSDVRRHMRALGLRDDVWFDGQHECDWPMYHAQINRRVTYAGPLAGHRVGTFTDGSNRRFLVTEEARGVWDKRPKKIQQPEFFSGFIEELLPGEQAFRFCLWLSLALASLRDGDFRPGQVCVFAGPPECGKSFLQYIITEILGGRSGNPMRYINEETTFNDDLAGTEHWMIEEPNNSTDIRSRLAMGDKLKELFYIRDFSIHPKGKKAIPLPLFRRGTVSINDEPELLQKLPPFNGSIEDKLSLYHCAMVEKAFVPFRDETTGRQDRKRLWQTVIDEVPMIRAWLLSKAFRVPKELRDDRAGAVSYHHPELKAQLTSFAPEVQLLELCDLSLFAPSQIEARAGEVHWEGKAIDLEQELRQSKFAFRADQILRGGHRAGTYLGRLAKSEPKRVSSRKVHGLTVWTVNPPVQEKD